MPPVDEIINVNTAILVPGQRAVFSETQKKQLGKFYTPRALADVLTDWAICAPNATVFDPSFGGCAFLYSAMDLLACKGVNQPGRQLFGADIDLGAKDYLTPLFEAGAKNEQFLLADFFTLQPKDFKHGAFDAVVGNPPYVRHHAIDEDARKRAVASLADVGFKIPGRASYWALFLLGSIRFLRPHGRLAMVLPGAFLHADYSVPIRAYLAKSFAELTVILLDQRVFDEAEEETVVLLADGYGRPHKRIHIGTASTINALKQTCHALPEKAWEFNSLNLDREWLRGLLDSEALDLLDSIAVRPQTIRLGQWARPRIGAVTGNNRFFVSTKSEQALRGIGDEWFKPSLTRATQLKGLSLQLSDIDRLIDSNARVLLLNPPEKGKLPQGVKEYLIQGRKTGASDNYKCRTRKRWYIVPGTFAPDAFINYMTGSWPRITLNEAGITCTNAIHRLVLREKRSKNDLKKLALGGLSTVAQLSAELIGRSYGGGVLKLELHEVSSLIIPISLRGNVNSLFNEVDALLRNGQAADATKLVDQVFLIKGMGLTQKEVCILKAARNQLFQRRKKRMKSSLTSI